MSVESNWGMMALDADYLHRIQRAANVAFGGLVTETRMTTPRDITVITLYALIVELSHGASVLMHSKSFSALPPVLRSLLEAHVEFRNLTHDPEYLKVFRLLDMRQYLSILKANRQWIADDEEQLLSEVDLAIERVRCEIRAANYEGLRLPDVKERFGLAGLAFSMGPCTAACAHMFTPTRLPWRWAITSTRGTN